MPRVEKRVARKDYPQQGIKAGDTYYYAKIKMQRGGRVIRSKTPLKPSQLTNSPFKSGWLAMQEAWQESGRDGDAMREAAEAIRSLGEEAQGSFDNMPEGLQQGDTGQLLEARANGCQEKADALDSLADEWDALEEPVEPLGDLEDDAENDQAQETYEEGLSEYESEVERLQDEADSHIDDMPEN